MSIHSIEDAKLRAVYLREMAAGKGEELSYSKALEMVAKEQGVRDWNTLRARLAKAGTLPGRPDISTLRTGMEVEGRYMNQPFTGRIVNTSDDGHSLRVAIHLHQAVDTVTFASFSNMRRRIQGTIGKDGRSAERTSGGIPHLVITEIKGQD